MTQTEKMAAIENVADPKIIADGNILAAAENQADGKILDAAENQVDGKILAAAEN